ncbi:MAG TPA: hypothetical protein VGJ37_07550 [Pyrinomonadaceae bacterium]|jgi:hypothetical protein
MTTNNSGQGGAPSPALQNPLDTQRYVAWFHELDAWTEYWDIYHPETRGRYYFGDDKTESGLLGRFLPRTEYPPAWTSWTHMALGIDSPDAFITEILKPDIAAAVMEVDALVARLFVKHFGDASNPSVQADYLEGMFRFAIGALPPATERDALIPEDDWRKPTAGHHALDADIMWFAWALQLEAAHAIDVNTKSKDSIAGRDVDHARRTLLIAGVATGCPADFAWHGHRRTRAEYSANAQTMSLLRERGKQWASDFATSAAEVHALYKIREWGQED